MDNKTIIISCAGMGTRLGMNIPKALVQINNKPLIIHTLEMLKDCKDIRIVVGYKSEEVITTVRNYRKDITFVYNEDYMSTGAGASVCLATKNAKEYILAMVGDLLIHPDDINKLLTREGTFACVEEKNTENPVLVKLQEDKIIGFSREFGDYEWVGICQFKTSELKQEKGNIYQMFEQFLPTNYMNLRVKEIDTPKDLENALLWIEKNYTD